MDISAIAGSSGKAATADAKLADDFDTFLSLLTTQLQNQDPLEPQDANEFTNQLVAFTGVEQSIATNKNLELLIGLNQAAASGGTVSYIGKTVVADGATSALESGQASWNYDLARNTKETVLTVTDASGRQVYAANGAQTEGTHTFSWDGRDNNGNPMADGLYTLNVQAEDAGGNIITTSTTIKGRVTAIDFSDGEPLLTVNGVKVGLDKVQSVAEPSA